MRQGKVRRRIAALLTSFGVVGAMLVALVGVTAGSAFTTSAGPTAYEYDCSLQLQGDVVAPFMVIVNGNTNVDSAFPTSATFAASGTVTTNLSGGFIAGLAANNFTSGSLDIDVTINAVNLLGLLSRGRPAPAAAWDARQIGGVTWASGSNVLNGNFLATDAGHFVSGGLIATIPAGAVITAVTPASVRRSVRSRPVRRLAPRTSAPDRWRARTTQSRSRLRTRRSRRPGTTPRPQG